jgi:hypothetical protein
MSPEEFLEKVKELGVTLWFERKRNSHGRSCFFAEPGEIRSKKSEATLDDFVYEEWRTGGISGGSCWDDGSGPDPHYATGGDPEPEFASLDAILLHFCPDIPLLKYKAITSACVKYDDWTENEYYGNCTYYGTKQVVLRDLYEKMKELSLI